MRRLAVGRIVGLLVAVVAVGVSAWRGHDALRLNAEFHEWIVARPMETDIDLAQPGETTVPFHQTCGVSHGEGLYLECEILRDSNRDIKGLFKNFSGNVTIKDVDGNEIESVTMNDETVRGGDGQVLLARFSPFRRGEYVAVIRIDSGAAALEGKSQQIYAQYQLCGLEQMPAVVAGVFAFGAGLVGLVAATCVLPGLLRFGVWRSIPVRKT